MKRLNIYLLLTFLICAVQAQEEYRERVFVHTDKSCYLAGETIWLKFCVVTREDTVSALSKVGYVELKDTEMPWLQTKIALVGNQGATALNLPKDMPTGTYQLTGYTRYMRNEGDEAYFKKELAVINPLQVSEKDRYELFDSLAVYQDKKEVQSDLRIVSLQSVYGLRSLVDLSIDGLPEGLADLAVSVFREDSLTVPAMQKNRLPGAVAHFSAEWIPEYEGHIISGEVPDKTGEEIKADIGLLGRDVRYIQGQVMPDKQVNFYTGKVYGKQDVVFSARGNTTGRMYKIELTTPFDKTLPRQLPVLKIYPKQHALLQRSLQVQLEEMNRDTTARREDVHTVGSYYPYRPHLSYDLDEYTRFKTLEETFVEFVRRVTVRTVNGKRRIKVLKEDNNQYNMGNTLVLLDGVPIYDHEEMLKYDPAFVRRIDVYSGKYMFGPELYECMVQFTTYKGNLSGIQLDNNRQMLTYDFPALPVAFVMPDYSSAEMKVSRYPDFRHTLYWNPNADKEIRSKKKLSFYTSDIPGRYRVVVEGLSKRGETIYATSSFIVSSIKSPTL